MESYNKIAASYESRVLVSARKFKDLGVGQDDEIELLEGIDRAIKKLDEILQV